MYPAMLGGRLGAQESQQGRQSELSQAVMRGWAAKSGGKVAYMHLQAYADMLHYKLARLSPCWSRVGLAYVPS